MAKGPEYGSNVGEPHVSNGLALALSAAKLALPPPFLGSPASLESSAIDMDSSCECVNDFSLGIV